MKWCDVDFKQLLRLQKRMEQLQRRDAEEFCRTCAKELAARLLAKVIRRTPVGQYPAASGMKGGTLRRGWTAQTQNEAQAGGSASVKSYVDSLPINKTGDVYQVEIINPVRYASFVEFGHRTRDHKRWISGRFMLTISEKELEGQVDSILEKKLTKFLGECINGK